MRLSIPGEYSMEFASIIREYAGPAGIAILLLCLLAILIKQLLAMMKSTTDSLAGLRKEISQGFEKQSERDHEQDRDIQYIKDNFARKEDIYRELGGWKSELSRLDEHIERNQKEQNEQLMEIMKILAKEK